MLVVGLLFSVLVAGVNTVAGFAGETCPRQCTQELGRMQEISPVRCVQMFYLFGFSCTRETSCSAASLQALVKPRLARSARLQAAL